MSLQHYWRDTKEGRTLLSVPAIIVLGPIVYVGAMLAFPFLCVHEATAEGHTRKQRYQLLAAAVGIVLLSAAGYNGWLS